MSVGVPVSYGLEWRRISIQQRTPCISGSRVLIIIITHNVISCGAVCFLLFWSEVPMSLLTLFFTYYFFGFNLTFFLGFHRCGWFLSNPFTETSGHPYDHKHTIAGFLFIYFGPIRPIMEGVDMD